VKALLIGVNGTTSADEAQEESIFIHVSGGANNTRRIGELYAQPQTVKRLRLLNKDSKISPLHDVIDTRFTAVVSRTVHGFIVSCNFPGLIDTIAQLVQCIITRVVLLCSRSKCLAHLVNTATLSYYYYYDVLLIW